MIINNQSINQTNKQSINQSINQLLFFRRDEETGTHIFLG